MMYQADLKIIYMRYVKEEDDMIDHLRTVTTDLEIIEQFSKNLRQASQSLPWFHR